MGAIKNLEFHDLSELTETCSCFLISKGIKKDKWTRDMWLRSSRRIFGSKIKNLHIEFGVL